MPVDDAITEGAGQWPPITLNLEWRDGSEDTAMWRSEVIKMVGSKRVERDLQTHLPHRKMVEYGGQQAFVMSPTPAGLINGEQKAIERIQKQKIRPGKAAQLAASTSAQTGNSVPAAASVMQSTINEPTYPEAVPAPQPASTQAAVDQQRPVQLVPTQPTQSTGSQSTDLNNSQMQMIVQQLAQLLSQQGQPTMVR